MANIMQNAMAFANMVKQQKGPNTDPSAIAKQMLGLDANATPQQALQQMLNKGMITQDQVNNIMQQM